MEIGRGNFYHGDCFEKMKNIPDHSVDLILTDPPYGCTDAAWDTSFDLPQMWREFKRILNAANGGVAMFCIQPFTTQIMISSPRLWFRHGWYWQKKGKRGSNPATARFAPRRTIEEILFFQRVPDRVSQSKIEEVKKYIDGEFRRSGLTQSAVRAIPGTGAMRHWWGAKTEWRLVPQNIYIELANLAPGYFSRKWETLRAAIDEDIKKERYRYTPQGTVDITQEKKRHAAGIGSTLYGETLRNPHYERVRNYPTDVLCYAPDAKRIHPTQKPVALLEYLIETYTKPGECVLDPFAGSASTCIAAEKTGRTWIGIEKDERFHEAAQKRIKEFIDNKRRDVRLFY